MNPDGYFSRTLNHSAMIDDVADEDRSAIPALLQHQYPNRRKQHTLRTKKQSLRCNLRTHDNATQSRSMRSVVSDYLAPMQFRAARVLRSQFTMCTVVRTEHRFTSSV